MDLQTFLFDDKISLKIKPFRKQLLKWIGNKQRFADEIVSYFPNHFGTYFEPFLGSGAVLGTLAPEKALASDIFRPLMEIWMNLKDSSEILKEWYTERWNQIMKGDKEEQYEIIKSKYNKNPNGADLLFLCRACYGGVVRFRQSDGYMSTPCGIHQPISPETFSKRVDEWFRRTVGVTFDVLNFEDAMRKAKKGDLIYCDPPYSCSQSILYGAQTFNLERLFDVIKDCKAHGIYVVLSIDGTKRSGNLTCNLSIPKRLFENEVYVKCGRSMLKRFQMNGQTLEKEVVTDRLLLTY